ncbi:MAG: purine-nucleoside phosphorylase [Bdellovibrionia bacterium]
MVQEKLQEAVLYIRSRCALRPQLGLILGSGLGAFVKEIKVEMSIPYDEIPHFAATSIEGHQGVLHLGHVNDFPIAVLQGRAHYYEGYPMSDVVFPTRVLAMLGINTLLLTNAAGGISPGMEAGDFMILSDHINLMGANPLMGPNLKNLGPRFPDMTEAYDRELLARMERIMKARKIRHHTGVYCAVSGPTYETPAEVRYLQIIGGHAVGMSTVPEAIAANHLGLRVGGVSCITNLASGISKHKLSHNEVTETAKAVEQQFCGFLVELLGQLKETL